MKIGVTVSLDILITTNTGISHDGAATTWLIGLIRNPSTCTATPGSAIEGMIGTKLVANFMSHIVNEEGISYRCR